MEDTVRRDIRRLLKTFGVKADETIMAYLGRNPGVTKLHVRVVLQDLTDYGALTPEGKLELDIEEEISGSG